MDNEINVLHALHGSLDERANDTGAISRFLSDTSANASGSILYLYERTNVRTGAKSVFYVICYGQERTGNRKRKASAKSCQSLDTWVSKVAHEELADTGNDSAVCDSSPAETTTSDLSLTTVLQRDPKGKSCFFSRCQPVLIPVLCSEIYSVFLNMKQNYIA